MEYQNRHERDFIKAVERLGFSLSAIVPHANYDAFYFYNLKGDTLFNANVLYNGKGYLLSLGLENSLRNVNENFDFTKTSVLEEIEQFAEEHGIKSLPEDPKVD